MNAKEQNTAAAYSAGVLPVSVISESPDNPRRNFDPAKLHELASSIITYGVLEPILVRPLKSRANGVTHEVVAGARRLRAARLARLTDIPVRIAELSDAQVLEIQVIENLQREDVHPLEEAEGFGRLLKIEGYTTEVIAEKIGKDRGYVYKRIQLARLTDPLKAAFLNGKINIGHALILSRLSEHDQARAGKERLFDGGRGVTTAADLDEWVRSHILLSLSAAPWKKDNAELVPAAGACTTCQKRSGANLALFDDLKKGDDRCLDGKCFQSKLQAHIAGALAEAEKAGAPLVKIASSWMGNELPKGVLNAHDYRDASKDSCEHSENAIVVAGRDHVGSKTKICRDKNCKVHNRYSLPRKRTFSEIWEQKKRELDAEIEKATRQATLAAVAAKATIGPRELRWIAAALVNGLASTDAVELAAYLDIKVAKSDEWKAGEKIVPRLLALGGSEFNQALLAAALIQHRGRDGRLSEAAKAYRVDAKAIGRRIAIRLRAEFTKKRDAAKRKGKSKGRKTSQLSSGSRLAGRPR